MPRRDVWGQSVRLAHPYVNSEVVAEREGFEPSMGLLPNRISNWTQKRDQRDLESILRSDAGVSRRPEAVERICGSTEPSTQKQHRPHQMVGAV